MLEHRCGSKCKSASAHLHVVPKGHENLREGDFHVGELGGHENPREPVPRRG